jgi:hypothetical protein
MDVSTSSGRSRNCSTRSWVADLLSAYILARDPPPMSSGLRAESRHASLPLFFVRPETSRSSLCPSSPKGRAEHMSVSPRPRRHVGFTWRPVPKHRSAACSCERCGEAACYGSRPRKQKTPAFRTQRSCRLATPSGSTSLRLDQILGSPDCWVLGPPTPYTGHRPFISQHGARHTARRLARKARTRDGAVASRSAPAMRPAPFQLERDGWLIVLAGKAGKQPQKSMCTDCG